MPTYSILGVSFWIPSFSDLTAAIVSPLQQAVSNILTKVGGVIYPVLLGIQGQIVSQVRQFIDPIASRISQVWNDLVSRLQSLGSQVINGLLSWLQNIPNRIYSLLSPILSPLWSLLNQVWNSIVGIASQVWARIQPWTQSLEALLRGGFQPLLSQILSAASWTLDLLGRSYPVLFTTVLGIGTLIDALNATVNGQPVVMEKIFAAKLNEVINPLGSLAKDLWTAFSLYIIKPLAQALAPVITWFDTQFRGLGGMVIDFMHSIALGGPEQALERATAIAFILGPLVTGINVGAQALELLHPIKHMGLVQTVTSCLDSLGLTKFSELMFGLLIAGALEKPIRQGLALRYRPELPASKLVDTMLFQQQIQLSEWRRTYALHGWNEAWIDRWYGSMWTEPSDRMIVGMIEGGEVELDWLQGKLQRRGYKPEDAARIMRYGSRKALANEIAAIIGEINADLQAGQIDILEARQELVDIGCKGSELEFRLQAMLKRMNRNDVKDKVSVLTSQVKSYDLTVQQYSEALIALNLRSARVSSLVEKEELRRKPTVDKPAEHKRELAISFYQRLFIEGAIPTEDRLRTYLQELVPALPADRVELVIEDAKIRQSKAVTAAA